MSRAVRAITALALVAAVAAGGGILRLKDDTSACTLEKAAGDELKHSCDVTTETATGGSASLRNLDDVLSKLQICPAGQGVDDATQRCADCVAGQTFNGRVDYMGCAAAQTSLKCPKGEGRDPATKHSDFYCTACSGGTGNYSAVNGVANCLPTTTSKTCGVGKGRVTATAQKDYHCIDCVSEGCTAGGSPKCSYNSNPTSKQACSFTAPGGHTCGKGQGWIYSTTTSNGYDCETCLVAGEDPRYSNTIDNTQCKDTPELKKQCPAGKGWTYSGVLAGGYACTPCVAGSSFSAANDRQQCDTNVVKPTCGAGRGVVADPTVQDGYRCEDCLDEAANPKRYGWSTANNKAACTPTIKPSSHTCPKGQGWIYSGDSATGYDCEVCVAGSEYSDSIGVQQCQTAAKVICPAGKGYVADNKVSSGYKCQDCLSPSGGRYMWSNTNDNTACKSKTTPYGTTCAMGKGWIHSGSASGGYTCETCGNKNPKEWSSTNDKTQCKTTSTTKQTCGVGQGWVYDDTEDGGYDCVDCLDPSQGMYKWSDKNDKIACKTKATPYGKTCGIGEGWVHSGSATGGYTCDNCVSGSTWSDTNDKTQCKLASKVPCPKGKGNVADVTAPNGWKCVSCTSGKYQHLDNNAVVCQNGANSKLCATGQGWVYNTKVNNGVECQACVAGTTWSSAADNTQCKPIGNKKSCGSGQGNWAVNDASNGWTCKNCPSGKYSSSTSASECANTGPGDCGNGKGYALSTSTYPGFTCSNCAKFSGSDRGKWKSGNNKNACGNCPSGKYASSSGASSYHGNADYQGS
eukprot:g5966.t1